ncbi:MAG: SPOR domain-containing protein [Paracoccus sp. (in: a-proteobacteria)]|nr:SPOR domain-containing protein [Paracoccus sp. (in: a-proteobacteria)]
MVGQMKRDWLVIGLALISGILLPGLVVGAPDPAPPPGFSGQQYIDGNGCVFVRDGTRWIARLDPDGQPVCGFPSSLDLRRLDPEVAHVLSPASVAPSSRAAEQLAELLAEGMRDTDLAVPLQTPGPGDPIRGSDSVPENPLQQQIATMLARRQSVTRDMAILLPDSICARLGYRDDAITDGVADPTGFCTGLRAPDPQPPLRVAEPVDERSSTISLTVPMPGKATRPDPARNAGDRAGTANPQAGHDLIATDPKARKMTDRGVTGQSRGPASVVGARPATDAHATSIEMIPAGARYVQVGVFSDDETAMAAINALARRGLPVARTRTNLNGRPRMVLAGPFTDRRRLVEVLNMLRRDGWPGAVAR